MADSTPRKPQYFSSAELEQEAARLETEGNMPSLQEYLAALDAAMEKAGLPVPGQPHFTPKDKRLLRRLGITTDKRKKPVQGSLNFPSGGDL